MNTSNAEQFIPLVQALAAGKTIQIIFNGVWIDVAPREHLSFSQPPESYRIKRIPQTYYIVRDRENGTLEDCLNTREKAECFYSHKSHLEIVACTEDAQ